MPNAAADCKGDSQSGLNLPAAPVVVLQIAIRCRTICRLQMRPVPLQLLSGAIGDIAQQRALGERTGIIERAARRAAGLARLDPFQMVADGLLDEGNRRSKAFKILFG